MAGIVEAARLLWCPGLAQTTGKPSGPLQDWLIKGTYAPTVAGKQLVLGGIDERELLSALGYDINRLSSAASETLRNVAEIPAIPKSMGWPYVKIYYSALFYVHSLLRIWGRSPSYLRTTDLLQVRLALNVYGLAAPFPLQTGQYQIVAKPRQFEAVLTPDKGAGGSHDAIWRELGKALAELKAAVAASQFLQSDKDAVTAQVDLATAMITNGGSNAAWPSFMRNDIHYRQSSGVWYPYKGKSKTAGLSAEIAKVLDEAVEPTIFLGTVGDDLVRFRNACLFLISFVRQILADLALVGGAKTFLKFGQTQFEAAYP